MLFLFQYLLTWEPRFVGKASGHRAIGQKIRTRLFMYFAK